MAHFQSLGQFVQRDHGWVALPAFEAANVLLTKGLRRNKRF